MESGKSPADRANAGEHVAPLTVTQPAPIRIRSAALSLIAVLLSIAAVRLAREVLIPVVVAVLLAYAFEPFVAFLMRFKLPRFFATTFLLAAIVTGAGAGAYSLSDEVGAVIDELPQAAIKLRQLIKSGRNESSAGTIGKVQEAAEQIEKAASEAAGSARPAPPGVTRVQVEIPTLRLRDYLWSGWQGATGLAGRAILVLFLVYFLLLSGDLFRRKLVRVAGHTLSRKRITVQILGEINGQIERFLVVRLLASVIVAATIWPVLSWAGLNHAIIWAVAAGLLNIIPYFGPAIVTGCLAVVSFLQFGTLSMAIYVAGISLAISSFEGWFVTPKLMGRAASMNEVAVFVGLIFWSWLWGAWGLLLAVPMMMIVKSVCDHIEEFRWIGELMGDVTIANSELSPRRPEATRPAADD